MAGMVLIKTKAEEELMFQLLKEFATKVIIDRRANPSETFKNYCNQGVYGILEVDAEKPSGHKLFEIALPEAFVGYIEYEIEKFRGFVSSAKV